MKRIVIVTVLAALAVTASAWAFATGDYTGEIKGDPDSGFSFNIRKTDAGRRVKSVVGAGMDYTCEDSSSGETSGTLLLKSFPVDEDGEFGGRSDAVIFGFDPPAKLTGKLKRGGRASGTIRVHGELDPKNNPKLSCDTGTLDWKAERGQSRAELP